MPAVVSQSIILVDDDRALRDSLSFSLELEGYTVESFESAEDFAERGEVGPGACLVLDHRLPGISGLQLLLSLRDQLIDAPALLITSNPTVALRKRALALGAAIVEKPLLSDDLLNGIRSMFERVDTQVDLPNTLSAA
ncbi:MAG: response regulator [Sphingomonas bacterium]|nr:response regulator [Sphingomonas bacterium]